MTTRRQLSRILLGFAVGAGAPAFARAERGAYPSRPVKIVVPFAAGGGPDVLARGMAGKLSQVLGVPTVVENIVGAGGIVAAQNAARAAPDGYTLLLGASSHVIQKAMQPSVKFDPLKDFALISRVAYTPSMLVVAEDSPYKSMGDLIAAARSQPGKLSYASGGVGTPAHLCAEAMAQHAKISVLHVPYKGSVAIIPSLLSGETQFAFPIAATAVPQVRGGKVRALAVSSARRMPAFADVPTLAELFNTPELALDAWFGLWAPAGTPQPVVSTLFKAVLMAYQDTALHAISELAGATVAPSASPAEFKAFMEAETLKYSKLVASAKLGVDK